MIKVSYILNSKLIIKKYGKSNVSRLFLTTDSRKIKGKNLFIALNGENFKGAKFIDSIISKSIKVIIYNDCDDNLISDLSKKNIDILFISCLDTLIFMQDLSSRLLSQWKSKGGTVFAITGSNGKTTTKDYLKQFLSFIFDREKVHATVGNFNNHIGVPLTILNLLPSHKYLILELGTNHQGEISFLSKLACPDHALITSVGQSHLEFFINVKNVFFEKIELFKSTKGNCVIYNKDVLEENIIDTKYIIANNFKPERVNKNIPESYNIENLNLCYLLLTKVFKSKLKRINKIYPKIKNLDKYRSLWLKNNNRSIYFDGYNANPTSMIAALNYFCSTKHFIDNISNCLFIIGDMNEMGNQADNGFKDVSMLLNQFKVLNVIFVGPLSKLYKKYFDGISKCFLTVDQLIGENIEINNYNIFIKGSRGIQLEKILTAN